jgi:hypothetical protein
MQYGGYVGLQCIVTTIGVSFEVFAGPDMVVQP